MATLIRKELRGLLPFIALVLLLAGTDLLDTLLTGIPHLQPLALVHEGDTADSGPASLFVLIFSLALTYGLLVRERDDGTQEFLDALPISRTSIFVAKVTAVLTVLALIVVLDFGIHVLVQSLSRTSLDPELHLSFLSTRALLNLAQLWVFMTFGLALSFLRRFGWLVAGLLIWTYVLLRQFIPQIEILNILALSEENVLAQRLVIPWRMLMVQGGLSLVLITLSYSLYLGAGDRLLRTLQNLDQSRLGSAVLLSCSFGIVIVAVSLFAYAMSDYEDTAADDVEGASVTYPTWNTSRSSTEHYRFIYPANLSRHVRPLVENADGVYQRVREFLEAPVGKPIEVDSTEGVPSHLAGFAEWDKIRLDFSSFSDPTVLDSVLGHETAHVFLERLSDSRLTQKFNSTRFFHEGVASYAEYHLFAPRQSVDVLHGTAAVMRARKRVDFDELVDDARFSAQYDLDLVYPLGLVFVESLVERYDQQSVARLARAMNRSGAPQNLEGLELWRDTFQACGYNLDDVLDTFFARLDREVEQRQAWIDSIPRPRAVLDVDRFVIELKVLIEDSDDWSPICRFRHSEDTPQLLYIDGYLDENNACHLERSMFPGTVVWYQVGVMDTEGHVIYEPWRSATLRAR